MRLCLLVLALIVPGVCRGADIMPPALAGADAIEVTDTLIAGSVLLGRVHGYSCTDTAQADALAIAKAEAASMGATGIYRVRYGTTGIVDGCLFRNGVHAQGLAFRRN